MDKIVFQKVNCLKNLIGHIIKNLKNIVMMNSKIILLSQIINTNYLNFQNRILQL